MKEIIFARVSSLEQEETYYSLDSQERLLTVAEKVSGTFYYTWEEHKRIVYGHYSRYR